VSASGEHLPLAERVVSFMAHLRLNGLAVGPGETASALAWLARGRWESLGQARDGLRMRSCRTRESTRKP